MIRTHAKNINPEIRFRKRNLLNLDFANDSIPGIVAFYAIVHFAKEQVGRAFGEIFRVLKLDEIFLFTYRVGKDTIHIEEFLGKKFDIKLMLFKTDVICTV